MMWIKRFLISISYSILHNIIAIAGLPILAIALLFVPRRSETLPNWLRFWDNGEYHFKITSDPDGLMGPKYYREARGTENKESISYWKLYWERFNWLALRNPADYTKYLLGFVVEERLRPIEQSGSVLIGDHEGSEAGTRKLVVINGDGKEYWEYYKVWEYPMTKGKYVFRLRLGWKIKDPEDDFDGKVIPYELSITPIKRRR